MHCQSGNLGQNTEKKLCYFLGKDNIQDFKILTVNVKPKKDNTIESRVLQITSSLTLTFNSETNCYKVWHSSVHTNLKHSVLPFSAVILVVCFTPCPAQQSSPAPAFVNPAIIFRNKNKNTKISINL